ncbi:tyrosine-type recombinase/integrase [Thauera aromatica]|uniref:tyrosine-type recombinase/integrase n=1 Tax=Thauera aromatica TaxID=59405 RepID=UPI001FFC4BFC|nr:integrase family protein [Thauera aromatica]MCK2097111.1 integrase family protein [Thauera aromatica]
MPRERLTETRVENWKPAKEAWLRDTDSHLAVRARPARGGISKVFIFVSTLDYKDVRITIGEATGEGLYEAREKAREWQKLIDQGKDPREVIREQEAAEQAAIEAARAAAEAERAAAEAAKAEAERQARYTLRALCDVYLSALERARKGKSANAARSLFKCHIDPDTANRPARDVTAHEVAALVRRVREAGKERAAGVLRSYLSAAYNAAKRAPFDSALPADLIPFGIEHNPVDAIPAIAVQKGDRRLSAGELRAYIGHLLRIGQESGPELADVALLLALYAGGQRMAQLLRAKVGDFDQDTATLRLWDGKGKRTQPREHLLPLAPHAAGMVEALVERAKDREQARAKQEGRAPELAGLWLFSAHGRVAMNPETVSTRAGEISTSMGSEPFSVRDIRRTVETMLAGLGISKDIRAQLLSHGISGVQAAHYDRHSYIDEKHAALVAWEARLAAIRKAERTPSNVVRLGQRAA